MKTKLFTLLFFAGFLFACGGGSKKGNEAAQTDETVAVDYSKPAYIRGKVKTIEAKGYDRIGDMVAQVDTSGRFTEITLGATEKVSLAYDEAGNLVKYAANLGEESWLPMFSDDLTAPWLIDMLHSYRSADIALTYANGKIAQFTDAKTGQTVKFSYDKDGRITGSKISDKKGTGFNSTSYRYDEKDGKKYTYVMMVDQIIYGYDQEGRLVESNGAMTDITYTDKNEIASYTALEWDNSDGGDMKPVATGSYTYTYDNKGNWIKREGTTQKLQDGAPVGDKQPLPVITRTITYYE